MNRILGLIFTFCLTIIPLWAYTEYQQGQNSSLFRGPVVFFNGGSSSGALSVSSTNPLPVSLPSSGSASNVNLTQIGGATVDVGSGTGGMATLRIFPDTASAIQCNAGTNLNTSALSTAANQVTEQGYVDGIETLLGTSNTNTGNIDVDATTLIGHVDGVETLIGTTNTNTGNIATSVSNIDTDTTTIIGHIDSIEGLVDGIEALLGTINTAVVTTITGYVDQIEGYVDGIEGYVDGIEGHLANLVKSINGPAAPTIDSYTQVAINLTTGADQVLASSAANKQIWVYAVEFTVGDADGQTVSFQDEDNTAITGIGEYARYGGFSSPPSGNFSQPLWKLGTDKDLEVDITGGDVDGYLVYAIVSI